jgi:hypothetical protein
LFVPYWTDFTIKRFTLKHILALSVLQPAPDMSQANARGCNIFHIHCGKPLQSVPLSNQKQSTIEFTGTSICEAGKTKRLMEAGYRQTKQRAVMNNIQPRAVRPD